MEAIVNQLGDTQDELLNAKSTNDIECDLEFLYDKLSQGEGLISYLKSKQYPTDAITKITDDKKFKNTVLSRIDVLLELMKKEGYSDSNQTLRLLRKVKGTAFATLEDWKSARINLKKIIDEIRPFNIKKMLELYNKIEESGEELLNKDVVLFLGHTGAGKSTTIHFLAGSQMVRDKSTDHIEPVNVTNKWLKDIITEFRPGQSVTRFVSAVPINLRQAGLEFAISDRKAKPNIVLCDTPGFGETRGVEVDVANGLGVVRAIAEAKSVKILLIVGIGDDALNQSLQVA